MDDQQHFDSLCEDCGVTGTASEPRTSVMVGLHEVNTALRKNKKSMQIQRNVATEVIAV